MKEAQRHSLFEINTLQSDHSPEFGVWFFGHAKKNHRYTRVGKPNDNSHIERFNRTLQKECLDRTVRTVSDLNKALKKYVPYYNEERLHLGISLRAPMQLITNRVRAID